MLGRVSDINSAVIIVTSAAIDPKEGKKKMMIMFDHIAMKYKF